MTVIDPELIDAIKTNTLFDNNSNKQFYNIIIKYFNKSKITLNDINLLEELNYLDSEYLYYAIPEVMYIIEKNIKNILK